MRRTWRVWTCGLGLGLVLLGAAAPADAQYFGRNKVQYRAFDFEVLKTEHFDVYYYAEEAEAAAIVSRMAERWYDRLSRFFLHELRGRQVLILYAVPSHFRQTNAIEGLIGEGTGGVTEAIKRRVVLPMSGSLSDTDHVLGHELVHAFQFDLTGEQTRDAASFAPEILTFPLWFVEGMAEYLSLGPIDSQTSMWLRDAALGERLPHLRDLDKPQYFPYRWGHAFWAFIGAKYGDRAVASLIRSAANPRYDLPGLARQLGTDPDSLTAEWHEAIVRSTHAALANRPEITSRAHRRIDRETSGGRYNLGPRLSPDGTRLVFFSERDRFSIDLYLAEADTGRIIRRLSRSATDPHFDSLEFLNSAGGWSPDGAHFVVAADRGGHAVLAFFVPDKGRLAREVRLDGLDAAFNPVFTPDGRAIVLSGNRGGLIDLYRVDLATGELTQLTADPFADLEPSVSPDGRTVVFVTERFSMTLEALEPGPLQLARLDLETLAVEPIAGFLRGKHLSPQISPDGRTVTFIADPDGVSNLYRMPVEGGPIEQVSAVPTGVAGITAGSPALTSASTGRLAYSVFEGDGHAIYVLDPADIVGLVAPPTGAVGALLPGRSEPAGDVFRLLENHERGLPSPAAAAAAIALTEPYGRKMTLDLVTQPTISAGISEFGGFVSGGISALFSDMLGDRVMMLTVQASGSLADVGGQVAYLNRRHRWNWAAVVEQMPYRIGYIDARSEPDPVTGHLAVTEVTLRQTSRGTSLVTAYPFSTSTRLEFSAGARSLGYTRENRTRFYSAETGRFIERVDTREEPYSTLYLADASAALVHDSSFYGATGPIYGARYRAELYQSFGSLHYQTVLADWRRYLMPVAPVTIALRGLHVGRYGRDAEHERLIGYELGYPELVRGYGIGSIVVNECAGVSGPDCSLVDSLIGSRLLVANLEVRAPLVGLLRGDLTYGPLPVEVGAFFDAGVAWTRADLPAFAGGTRQWVRSVGGLARVNAFGLLIVEIAAARPLDRPTRSWQWQVGIRQGF
ncbi:MAG TPA: hypothetical protein VMM93_01120 [Vicinamibacterales bacterium]|nr:hypothetical protein [Vicinamibacterales bacterium]